MPSERSYPTTAECSPEQLLSPYFNNSRRTKRMTKRMLMLVAVLMCMVSASFAGTVYNNGGPNQQSGNEITQWIGAEDFMIPTPTTVTDVHFWSLEDPGGTFAGSIWYGIYNNVGGTPNLGNPGV